MLGACLVQFTAIGLLFSYGLFFKIFEDEFGWSRTVLSSCISIAFLMMGILAIFAGRLNDRYGPTAVVTTSGLAYGAGFALIPLASEPWHLFAIFATLIGLGLSTHDVVTLSTVARWFERRRGAMTGVVKVGTATGQIAVPPFAALLIATLGWRTALVTLGVLAAFLMVMAALAMKSPPGGPSPGRENRAPDSAPDSAPDLGPDFAAVRRTRIFWTLCAVQFLFFPALMTIPLHIVVHGMDLGLTAAVAATLLSVTGASSIVGRLTVGTLVDRIGGRNAYVLCFVPLIGSLAVLAFIQSPWALFAVLVFYGFAHGGLFTVVSPTIAEYFGTRAHGASFGVVLFFGTVGGSLGPIMAGRVFDVTGSYDLAFGGLAALTALGLALVLSLPPPPRTPA